MYILIFSSSFFPCFAIQQECKKFPMLFNFQASVVICCCSVAKSCPTVCNPMDCSRPDVPVLHCLSEFAQRKNGWHESPACKGESGDLYQLLVHLLKGKIPWREIWQPTLVFLLGQSLGQRRLVGFSP